MYRINASDVLNERVLLTGRGKNKLIRVKIHIDTIIAKCHEQIAELDKAQAALQKDWCEKNYTAFAKVVEDLYRTMFGSDTAEEIFDYFDHDFWAMLVATYPFISDVVLPKMRSDFAKRQRR